MGKEIDNINLKAVLDDPELKELHEICKPVYEWLTKKYTFIHEIVINWSGATLKTNTAFIPEAYLTK